MSKNSILEGLKFASFGVLLVAVTLMLLPASAVSSYFPGVSSSSGPSGSAPQVYKNIAVSGQVKYDPLAASPLQITATPKVSDVPASALDAAIAAGQDILFGKSASIWGVQTGNLEVRYYIHATSQPHSGYRSQEFQLNIVQSTQAFTFDKQLVQAPGEYYYEVQLFEDGVYKTKTAGTVKVAA